jgi:hypothetical protein
VYDERVTDDLVERMHAVLAGALQRTRPDAFGSPVTVAEIYQDLVPYRSVRSELGFDMNADYEHTLLRLLSGEADLARLEPSEARDELRRELDSPNPNVGLFRKFAACDVWISARSQSETVTPETVVQADADDGWAPRVAQWLEGGGTPVEPGGPAQAGAGGGAATPEAVGGSATPEAGWTDEGAESELLLDEAMAVFDEIDERPVAEAEPEVPPVREESDSMAAAVPVRGDAQGREARAGAAGCAFCGSDLPTHRRVRFCPFCGADQTTMPCVACGEPIEAGWKFCVACGSAAPETAPI